MEVLCLLGSCVFRRLLANRCAAFLVGCPQEVYYVFSSESVPVGRCEESKLHETAGGHTGPKNS